MLRRLVIGISAAMAITACEGRPVLPSTVAAAQYSGDGNSAVLPAVPAATPGTPATGDAATGANPPPAAGDAAAAKQLALNTVVDKWVPPTYEGDVKPLLDANCTSCHNPANLKGGIDLSTADNAKLRAAKIVAEITSRGMPPAAADGTAPQATLDSVDLLASITAKWAEAPSNFALTFADIKDLNYTAAIEPLNSRLCATCHSGAAPKGNVVLASETDLTTKIDKFISVVTAGTMPPNMDAARQKRIQLLMEEWKLRLGQP